MKWTVCVEFFHRGLSSLYSRTFDDGKKARDYYTDCLVKYPNNKVNIKQIQP